MHRLRRILLVLVVLGGLTLSSLVVNYTASANEETDYQALELFTDVLSIIRNSYVEEVEVTDLIYGAIRGMLTTLDPHSSFLTPDMYQEMKDDTQGEFGGLGIEITLREDMLLVVTPIEDTPAFQAGIKAGDHILKIDDRPTKDMDIMEAVRLMRGPKGDSVHLTIRREGLDKPLEFTIVRDIIHMQSVKSRLLGEQYVYVRLSQFQSRTAAELKSHLLRLREESEGLLKGVVLDLRNNPGGLLDQAVAVSDMFLENGLIVYTEGREDGSQLRFNAQKSGTEPNYPIVVLINGGSASAAEIVAGALHDHERAIILGEQSFGKGSVQSIIPLGDDSGLRLTTARYFTPSGISIQARGITPDILVSQAVLTEEKENPHVREKDLENHFQPLKNTQSQQELSTYLTDADKADYQLMRALDLLKGLDILSRYQTEKPR